MRYGARMTLTPATLPRTELLGADLIDQVLHYQQLSRAPATLRAYATDWQCFTNWCARQSLQAMPASPLTVAAFLASEAASGRAVATIQRRAAAIRFRHQQQCHASPLDHPEVLQTLEGIRRSRSDHAPKAMRPLSIVEMQTILAQCDTTLTGLRDAAVLALGFAGAFRRAELVALKVADLDYRGPHLVVTVRQSKTDQTGMGQLKPIWNGPQLKAVTRLQAWLDAAGITAGPLFRGVDRWGRVGTDAMTAQSVRNILQQHAQAAGHAGRIAAHSLRAGFITSAAEYRVSLQRIMEVTRHTDPRTVLRYTRRADLFLDHAGEAFL